MSSALRKVIKRRTHKERSQPSERSKFGLLEKHKDYKQRATNYHAKQDAIQNLQQKADERNPDEFYFAMEKSRTRGGVHKSSHGQPNKYTHAQLVSMKTQDIGHVRQQSQAEAKKLDHLQSRLHMLGAPAERRHHVFMDNAASARSFDPAQYFETDESLLERTYNRPRLSQLEAADLAPTSEDAPQAAELAEKRRASVYQQLLDRQQRHQQLATLAADMTMQKELMAGGGVRKLKAKGNSDAKPVYKWKRERKR
ncbi:hypothetical protein WJX84_010703 [Apatococcus fuscideae]|uniref:U3 small nucleolar RNA-associated protein 11 n=1 Tax=Apatococcus fuscideae TaxID=2026836 RepID=A0AAW1T5T2_9CHLO